MLHPEPGVEHGEHPETPINHGLPGGYRNRRTIGLSRFLISAIRLFVLKLYLVFLHQLQHLDPFPFPHHQ